MGISLTKWISNSRKVIESVPTSERVSDKDCLVDQLSWSPRALGARWNAEADIHGFKIYLRDNSFTRRGVLFIVSSIYEPVGFAAPFILPAKRRLQNSCRRGLGWDVIVSDLVELARRSPKAGVTQILLMFQADSICQVHQFANDNHIAWGRVFSTDAAPPERVQALS